MNVSRKPIITQNVMNLH